jgi:hypothetical protein
MFLYYTLEIVLAQTNVKQTVATIRVEGGIADEGLLPAYDFARMALGFVRSLHVVAHAFANDDEVRKHAERATHVEAYAAPASKGCFEESIELRFSSVIAKRIPISTIVDTFWDYLAFSWSGATGQVYVPKTSFLTRRLEKNPLLADELSVVLEGSLRDLQRPINSDKKMTIELARPRVSNIVIFNARSLAHVTPQHDQSAQLKIVGTVTKLNRLSGIGRMYTRADNRTVPFYIADNDQVLVALAAESLSEGMIENEGFKVFRVSKVETGAGHFKRYIVHAISRGA